MAPPNNERQPGHTGTIPKSKVRNNCNVPQEAVTPTRRDMTSNLVTTSLDWVPVSEYNTRSNYNQSRKPSNNTSDPELTDLDNSVSFESGFGRFVPVRPQPRVLPLNVQNRDNIGSEQHEDITGPNISTHTLHPYAHQMQNGLIPHTNHAATAVMIVNPTTPNAVTGNMSQPFNAPSQNRNNLSRNINSARNNFDNNSHSSNNNSAPSASSSRPGTKSVNLINNMYDQGQGNFNNLNENNHVHRESARALGEAIVAACPDAAAVERRLGQIREYIRVTSSLVDTMRNSEDEAFIEHTKEEYDELVQMVMTLKESESKLQSILLENKPDNVEVPADETTAECGLLVDSVSEHSESTSVQIPNNPCIVITTNDNNTSNSLKKVTNIENEQINKTMQNIKNIDSEDNTTEAGHVVETPSEDMVKQPDILKHFVNTEGESENKVVIEEIETLPAPEAEVKKDDQHLNEELRKNILSCVEKVAMIEEMKSGKSKDFNNNNDDKDLVTRPVSVQSNGSMYSENELWQNEIKNKMELSQMRLAALKQQQKRLLKYQEEAKQQLEEINRERQQDIQPSTSHDNFSGMQNQSFGGNYQHSKLYAANQIGVATTLPHSADLTSQLHAQISNNMEDHGHSAQSNHSHDERYSQRDTNVGSGEEAGGGGRDSEPEDDEGLLNERSRVLQMKLQDLQMKKQHMENLVSEFQKLQMATRLASSHNTYSSSGEDSAEDEPSRKCNKVGGSVKNEDPFKLMEIKAIKTALQKTKDLMRSVENYEADHLSNNDDSYQIPGHSNIHDNKSEGGGSMGGWSNDGSMCRVRNSLPQRHKFTNEQHSQQQQLQNHQLQQQLQQTQQLQQQMQQSQQQHQQQQQSHEANLASLQELAQELRMETEKIMGERARIKDMISNKVQSKQKCVNSLASGPAERRQQQLRALLADKQRELEALLNKQKVLSSVSENQPMKADSRTASVVNQSYNSEQEDPDSRSEQILMDSEHSRENENFRAGSAAGGDSLLGARLGSTYSDSDSASRNKSNQRNRARRRQALDRQTEENNVSQSNNVNQARHEPRAEPSNVNMVPPITQNPDSTANMAYPHLPPPCWNTTKSNQDMRNQFTQNSHSQTMDRLLGTPHMSFPPSVPFNMMMPYGVVGGCSCGCGFWGAWCWQQLALQQREMLQLRDQLTHLEERWRAETASHTLNNQVPPGNRANNYWDNFRSYSRQNLLSANSKTNADGHLAVGPAHNPQPLVERSHNSLRPASPGAAPKRNADAAPAPPDEPSARHPRRNVAYERSLSFSSAPDVLNVNQNLDTESGNATHSRNTDDNAPVVSNVNINRQEPASNPFRNLNITSPIPEIVQSHSNNLNTSASKRKSSSKLPAKNSTNRRNFTLDYSQTSNVNIASTSETPNPNLASTSREVHDKATSKLFDLLRENVYSEVTALIGVNESHPDFLIQLFRELQLISSDPLRQRVLQSIRNVLSHYDTIIEGQSNENTLEESRPEDVTTTSETNNYHDCNATTQNACTSTIQVDNKIVRFLLLKSEEICTTELLEALATQILSSEGRYTQQSKKKLIDYLSKYEGLRVCDISSDIIENLPLLLSGSNDCDESQQSSGRSEPSILQDVAGSLNLFSSSDPQLHQMNACPYDMWPGHVHMDIDGHELNDNSPRSSQEGKIDLLNCSEMQNGDLAEADQTHEASEAGDGDVADALPDVVDTDEVTPTEAEAEWLGLDRVPTRLHMEESSEKQKGNIKIMSKWSKHSNLKLFSLLIV
ncbi:pericentriolar material 1 protein isoform X1 [Amyelois transitella]|uniref:pericentriolar material 1 protein isoform X1 n=1 Tax=Amyelois transitella TaxID=680683 RepID=UPI002990552E|nr:pericentriolar material 1 protein isoform X1 [Amyelois transitella]